MFKKTLLCLAVASSLSLSGCGSNDSTGINENAKGELEIDPNSPVGEVAESLADTQPVFNPVQGQVPVPNDFIFDQLASDGTFSDPVVPESANPVQIALGGLSGASTIAPIDIPFNGPLTVSGAGQPDANSVVAPGGSPIPNPTQNVYILEVDYGSGDPVQALTTGESPTIVPALIFAGAAAGDPGAGQALVNEITNPSFTTSVISQDGLPTLRIMPTKPLKPKTRYVVIVTDELLDANGNGVGPSLSYLNLVNTDAALPSTSLDALRTLATRFWEAVATGYFTAVVNPVRAGVGLPELTTENIALSYSFTTTGDEKVMEYMANPTEWFDDQVTTFARLATSRVIGTAANIPGYPVENIDISGPSGTPDGVVDFFDYYAWAATSVALFPATNPNLQANIDAINAVVPEENQVSYPDFETALAPIVGAGGPCNGLTGPTAIACVGGTLSFTLAAALPTPADRSDTATISSANIPVQLVSATVSSLMDTDNSIQPLVSQGTIGLPFYLGVPSESDGSAIQESNWVADAQLARLLNESFAAAGLALPQGINASTGEILTVGEAANAADYAKSTRVNYIYPFPQQIDADPTDADIDPLTVPWLAVYPSDAGACPKPWKTLMYQHGITTDRSTALSIGTFMAERCYATLAIDLTAHGVAPVSTDERLALSETLLETGQEGGLPPSLGPTEANQQALVAGVLTVGFVQTALNLSETAAQALINTVLSGGTSGDADLDTVILTLTAFENTVAGAGSTIPGLMPTENERHFNFTADASLQPVPMNFEDESAFGESGSLFINLTGFLNTRDKNRQGVLDLLNLRQSIANLNIDGVDGADLDDTQVFFAGHSLGTVTGAGFVTVANSTAVGNVTAATLLTPASGIVRMLENSPTFAPRIVGGLTAAGLTQGSASYETFLHTMQSALDAADPISFADNLNTGISFADLGPGAYYDPANSRFQTSADPTGMLMVQIAGRPDANGNPALGFLSDQVTTNETETVQLSTPFGTAFPNILSGVDELAVAMGAVNTLDSPAPSLTPDTVISRISFGAHSMYVLPVLSEEEEAAFGASAPIEGIRRTIGLVEGYTQMLAFFEANGEIQGNGPFVDAALDVVADESPLVTNREQLCGAVGLLTSCSSLETEAAYEGRVEKQLNLEQ